MYGLPWSPSTGFSLVIFGSGFVISISLPDLYLLNISRKTNLNQRWSTDLIVWLIDWVRSFSSIFATKFPCIPYWSLGCERSWLLTRKILTEMEPGWLNCFSKLFSLSWCSSSARKDNQSSNWIGRLWVRTDFDLSKCKERIVPIFSSLSGKGRLRIPLVLH